MLTFPFFLFISFTIFIIFIVILFFLLVVTIWLIRLPFWLCDHLEEVVARVLGNGKLAFVHLGAGFEVGAHLTEEGSLLLRLLLVTEMAVGVTDTQRGQEVHEERPVEILAELVEDKPVAEGAVADVVLDLHNLYRPLEVPVHPHVDETESHCGEPGLDDAIHEAESPDDGEKQEPPPEDQEHLVIDHVQRQHTDGIDILLAASRAPPPVVTRG